MGQCASRRSMDGEGWDESPLDRRGCWAMAKERRARFYILRKCVLMLLCWRNYDKYAK
uniref:Uncharacterized protein n=1 Tax=Nelumbo nucifera TaxID=4432 RepID=A0A822ZQB7_NELNU|nr:TPA_asm: hypothetical protein HUJ06_016617 [Nelumbo nucifera]